MKMKKLFALLIIATFMISIPSVAAANATPSLGKIVFIHKKADFVKPPWAGKPSGGGSEGYAFILRGYKWKDLPIDYVIDPDDSGLSDYAFITSAISSGAEEWDQYTSSELFGTFSIVYDATYDGDDGDRPDGRNELLFGDITDPNVIAVTVTWFTRVGRQIIEFDIMFDIDFTWGDAGDTSETELGDTSVMDLQNIATHELGHGVGLADLYEDDAKEQTMYGIGFYGETKKRTLNTGDIAGIQELYG